VEGENKENNVDNENSDVDEDLRWDWKHKMEVIVDLAGHVLPAQHGIVPIRTVGSTLLN
jgi:hypothetical protein